MTLLSAYPLQTFLGHLLAPGLIGEVIDAVLASLGSKPTTALAAGHTRIIHAPSIPGQDPLDKFHQIWDPKYMPVEFLLRYNKSVPGGYIYDSEVFTTAVEAGADDGYKGVHGYDEEWEARNAAVMELERVKSRWPDLNDYPYYKARIFRREVTEWEKY